MRKYANGEVLHSFCYSQTNRRKKTGCNPVSSATQKVLRPGNKANSFIHGFQRNRRTCAGFFRTVFHHFLQESFIVTETVITLLKLGQHTGNGLCDFTFQMTIHFAFEVLFQLRNALAGDRREDIQDRKSVV